MVLEFPDLSLHYDVRVANGVPPVLFLHSALGSSQELEEIRGRFAERSTITIDLPGHGESTTTREAIDTQWIGEVLCNALDRLSIVTVDVVGYSLGGYVGLELAARAPKKVRSVVSHAMKYYWDANNIEAAVETFQKARVAPRTIALTATLLRNFNERQLAASDIRSSNVPALLTTGALDDFVTAVEVERLANAIGGPQASATIFPEVRQSLRSLPTDTFDSAIRQFWKNLN
jgi:pimeloyl-ACP methyl ester carboxylesterase